MRIGELAKKTELSTSRIRFYEAQELIPRPTRGGNGYREYPDEAVALLRLIDGGQRLGFSLSEIRDNLTQAAPSLPSTRAMYEALQRKLVSLDQHIREVKARRKEIVKLIEELEDCD